MKHINELLKTCDGVERLPQKCIRYVHFWGMRQDSTPEPYQRCGWAACIIGWMPVFAPKTLIKRKSEQGDEELFYEDKILNAENLAKYFAISAGDVIHLFFQRLTQRMLVLKS